VKVISSDGKLIGKATGSEQPCRLEGCNGRRIGVRWSDGSISFPCTKGMFYNSKGDMQIGN
jgi:hypothetical protein